jgi:hypothetical protein
VNGNLTLPVTLLGTPIATDWPTPTLAFALELDPRPFRILTNHRAARVSASTEPVSQAINSRFTRVSQAMGSRGDFLHRGNTKGIQVHIALAGSSSSVSPPLLSCRICPPAYERVMLRQDLSIRITSLHDPEGEV